MKKVYCIVCKAVYHCENGEIALECRNIYGVFKSKEKANSMIKYYIKYDTEHKIGNINRYYKIVESYLH